MIENHMKSFAPLFIAGVLLAGVSLDASAANFNGKLDVVDYNSASNSARYYSYTAGLSIFAPTGVAGDLLREAYFEKATVNVSYTPIACPGGITGACGNLLFVSVSAAAIP